MEDVMVQRKGSAAAAQVREFAEAADRYIGAVAPTMPATLRALTARMASTAEVFGDDAVTEEDQHAHDSNQDWVWPEMQQLNPHPLGQRLYQRPADATAAEQAQRLVEQLNELERHRVSNRLQQFQVRQALEALTGPPIPWHLRHLLGLVRLRLQAWRVLRYSEEGPEAFFDLKQDILSAVARGKFVAPEQIDAQVEEAFARHFKAHNVDGSSMLLCVAHARRVTRQLQALVASSARLATELGRLEPRRLQITRKCRFHRDASIVPPHEEALPPLSLVCQCAGLVWTGQQAASRVERLLRLWTVAALVGARRSRLPVELMLENASHYRAEESGTERAPRARKKATPAAKKPATPSRAKKTSSARRAPQKR